MRERGEARGATMSQRCMENMKRNEKLGRGGGRKVGTLGVSRRQEASWQTQAEGCSATFTRSLPPSADPETPAVWAPDQQLWIQSFGSSALGFLLSHFQELMFHLTPHICAYLESISILTTKGLRVQQVFPKLWRPSLLPL